MISLARLTKLVTLLAASLLCAVVAAQPSSAGEYLTTTDFCDWQISADGWNGGIQGGCGTGYGIIEETGHTPIGTWQWWRSNRLPAQLNLNSVVYTASWNNGRISSDAYPFETRVCNSYAESGASPCASSAIDYFPGHSSTGGAERSNACLSPMTDSGQAQTCIGLLFARFTPAGNADLGGAQVGNVRMKIADYTAPVVSTTLANYAISQGGWLRGSASTGASATDTNGSGMTSMSFVVVDDLPHSLASPKTCYYGSLVPCATSTSSAGAFDTTTLSDGPHTGRYSATDAGGMTGTTPNFTFKVDNTKPDVPSGISAVTNGSDGWSSNNSFGANWANGAEVGETNTQSGIASVIVDVNPTNPGPQSDPTPVTVPIGGATSGITATTSSIAGVSLPSTGQWTLRLQLVDRAGNVSDVGDGSGNSADSDVSIGYDPNAPAKPVGQANGWISRAELADGYDQKWSYTTPPITSAPLCGWAGKISSAQGDDPGTVKNVPGDGATRSWKLPANLTEGDHYVNLRSVSCAGLASAGIESVLAPVDLTDPVPSYFGVESGKWYKTGKTATIGGIDALSGMWGSTDANPNSYRTGAYIRYTVNGDVPAPADVPRGSSGTVTFTAEGQKTLSFSPVDLAGNEAKPTVVTFGIDGTNPHGHFAAPDSSRPTLLQSVVADDTSGIEYSVISVRKQGGSDWVDLPTSLVDENGSPTVRGVKSGLASARFPDTSLPQGTYDVRVAAYDLAGNEINSSKFKDGSTYTINNPMRSATSINAKLFKAIRSCGKKHCSVKRCTKKTKGICYRVFKGKVVLVGGSTTIASAFSRGAVINGVLSDENGKPLRNQPVVITTKETLSGKTATVGTVTTDSNGIYGLRIPAGMSRTVTARYPGTELRQDASTTVNMGTQAKLKLKISKRHSYTGKTVTFSGKVTSFDGTIPAAGKIVALQFYALKKWRPAVGIAHTDKKGNFKIKYKFDGRRVKAKILFRVVAPSEDGWGHVFSASKTTVIRIN